MIAANDRETLASLSPAQKAVLRESFLLVRDPKPCIQKIEAFLDQGQFEQAHKLATLLVSLLPGDAYHWSLAIRAVVGIENWEMARRNVCFFHWLGFQTKEVDALLPDIARNLDCTVSELYHPSDVLEEILTS